MSIRKEDIVDADIVDEKELRATGNTYYVTGVAIVSIVSSTKTVTVSNFYLEIDDTRVESGDQVTFFGNAAAGPVYTVDAVIDNSTFTVIESIPDAVGGTVSFKYKSGASKVGFNSTGLTVTTADNVQDAIKDIANNATGISSLQHENLNTLVHNIARDGYSLVQYSGNDVVNYTIWTSALMQYKIREYAISYTVTPCNKRVNQVVTVQYDGYGGVVSTLTETVQYNGNKIQSIISTKT